MKRLLAIVLLIAFGAPVSAQPLTKLKFSNDWVFQGHTSYLHLAKAKGYFEQEGLDVTIDSGSGSTVAIQRIASGAYDVGLGDMSSLIEVMGNNPDVKQRVQAVYIKYDQLPAMYTSLKKAGIRSFRDLQGKRMAAGTFEAVRKLWPLFARAAKIDPGSVTFVTVDPSLHVTAVLKGDADFFGAFTPQMEWNQGGVKTEDIAVQNIADIGVRLYGNAVLVSKRLIEENPKALAGFLRAFNRAFKEGLANPATSVKYLKQRDGLIDEALETRRFVLLMPSMVTPYTKANGLGGVDPATLAKQIDEVSSVFSTKTKVTSEELYTAQFLPPRVERMLPESLK